jgi:hypothetical protein
MAKPVSIDVSQNPGQLWLQPDAEGVAALEVPFNRVLSDGDLTFNENIADQDALNDSGHKRHTHRFEVEDRCLGADLQFFADGIQIASAVLAGGSKFVRSGKLRPDEDKAGIEVRWDPTTLKKVVPS